MLQTVLYIPGELFGLPTFGFGLLLAVWAVASVILLAFFVRRQGFNADTIGHVQVLAVLGIAIAFVLPALCDARGLPIRGYGLMILLAVVSGMSLLLFRARRAGVDPEMIFALAFWMIVPGIVGARAVYVAEYWSSQYWPVYLAHGPAALAFAVVNVAAGGLVVYGSFVAGMLGLFAFWRRYRIPLLATSDLIAPSLLLGLALGRVGCALNGCCYGGTCDLPWAIRFPWNSPVQQHMAEDGATGLDGLTFRDGREGVPAIAAFDADSPFARQGLQPGMEIRAINGIDVRGDEQPPVESDTTGCSCSRAEATDSPRSHAAGAVLTINRLALDLRRGDHGSVEWPVDDPPPSQVDVAGRVKVFGLEVSGSDGEPPLVTSVRRGSPEARAGIVPGQRIASVSGREVDTIGQLRALLDEHRKSAWLVFAIVGRDRPVVVDVPRPLPRSPAVHPTQIYSTIGALILCLFLLAYDRFRRRDGALTAWMITLYPITRFLEESIRTDEGPIWGTPFTISQNISLALLVIGIALWLYILTRPPRLAWRT